MIRSSSVLSIAERCALGVLSSLGHKAFMRWLADAEMTECVIESPPIPSHIAEAVGRIISDEVALPCPEPGLFDGATVHVLRRECVTRPGFTMLTVTLRLPQ